VFCSTLPCRLSHDANCNLTWEVEARKWSGTLTVPAGGIYNGSVTTGEESAVFGLLMKLDRVYRHLPEDEGACNLSAAEKD
jgi:hypothetical protein